MDMATTTHHKEPAMNTFQIGTTYTCRSSCNWDTIFAYTVISRTAKFITLTDGRETKRVGVKMSDGVEIAEPEGRYSMSPVIYADRVGVPA